MTNLISGGRSPNGPLEVAGGGSDRSEICRLRNWLHDSDKVVCLTWSYESSGHSVEGNSKQNPHPEGVGIALLAFGAAIRNPK